MTPQRRTDWLTFAASSLVVAAICGPLIVDPESGAVLLPRLYDQVAESLGPVFLLAGVAVLVFLGWIAFSRHGAVRLGGQDEAPEFSTYSWAGMLFCAGIGAGLMYWAAIEWAYYLDAPPFGVEPRSREAMEWASTYGLFHWGPTAWAFYCLPTLAIGYAYHNRGARFLRLSVGCSAFPVLGPDRPLGRLIDLLFMLSLLGGAGSSLGFSTPMIAALVARIAGIEADFRLEAAVMVVVIILFAASAALGIRQGIKRLSDLNIALLLIFLAFVFAVGPTIWLLKTGVNGYGLAAQNFIRMNSWTEAFGDTGFVKDWTVFYWAWWIAYGPVVGLFVARISRGRTLREIIGGMLGYGTLGAGLFFVVLGNYGLHLEITGAASITQLLDAEGGSKAIVAVLETLPAPVLAMAVFCVAAVVFSATTYDSASYILASSATRNLPAGLDPALWLRLFWAFMLGVLPLTLLFVGGLRVVQTATLLAAAPLVLIGVAMAASLTRSLHEDECAPGGR